MLLENKEYNIRNKIKCDCGYEFNVHDIELLKRINETGFYSNIVKHYSHAKCKQCGKDVILLLKQVGQTYKIIDTATENVKEDIESGWKNVIESAKSCHKNVINDESKPITSTDKISDDINEFICPVCKKVCKSQIGLNSHIKTHQNN